MTEWYAGQPCRCTANEGEHIYVSELSNIMEQIHTNWADLTSAVEISACVSLIQTRILCCNNHMLTSQHATSSIWFSTKRVHVTW